MFSLIDVLQCTSHEVEGEDSLGQHNAFPPHIFDLISLIWEWLHHSEIFYIHPLCKSNQNALGLSYFITLRDDFTLSNAALLLLTTYRNQDII